MPPTEPKPCDQKRGRYWCTLDLGHEGQHIAGGPGGVVFARWANKPKEKADRATD